MAKQAKGAEGIIAANAVDISWLGKRHATLFVIGRASNGSVWGAGTQMVVWGGESLESRRVCGEEKVPIAACGRESVKGRCVERNIGERERAR